MYVPDSAILVHQLNVRSARSRLLQDSTSQRRLTGCTTPISVLIPYHDLLATHVVPSQIPESVY